MMKSESNVTKEILDTTKTTKTTKVLRRDSGRSISISWDTSKYSVKSKHQARFVSPYILNESDKFVFYRELNVSFQIQKINGVWFWISDCLSCNFEEYFLGDSLDVDDFDRFVQGICSLNNESDCNRWKKISKLSNLKIQGNDLCLWVGDQETKVIKFFLPVSDIKVSLSDHINIECGGLVCKLSKVENHEAININYHNRLYSIQTSQNKLYLKLFIGNDVCVKEITDSVDIKCPDNFMTFITSYFPIVSRDNIGSLSINIGSLSIDNDFLSYSLNGHKSIIIDKKFNDKSFANLWLDDRKMLSGDTIIDFVKDGLDLNVNFQCKIQVRKDYIYDSRYNQSVQIKDEFKVPLQGLKGWFDQQIQIKNQLCCEKFEKKNHLSVGHLTISNNNLLQCSLSNQKNKIIIMLGRNSWYSDCDNSIRNLQNSVVVNIYEYQIKISENKNTWFFQLSDDLVIVRFCQANSLSGERECVYRTRLNINADLRMLEEFAESMSNLRKFVNSRLSVWDEELTWKENLSAYKLSDMNVLFNHDLYVVSEVCDDSVKIRSIANKDHYIMFAMHYVEIGYVNKICRFDVKGNSVVLSIENNGILVFVEVLKLQYDINVLLWEDECEQKISCVNDGSYKMINERLASSLHCAEDGSLRYVLRNMGAEMSINLGYNFILEYMDDNYADLFDSNKSFCCRIYKNSIEFYHQSNKWVMKKENNKVLFAYYDSLDDISSFDDVRVNQYNLRSKYIFVTSFTKSFESLNDWSESLWLKNLYIKIGMLCLLLVILCVSIYEMVAVKNLDLIS